jgi:cell division protein FtsI/penicillin-binding protein 2
MRQVFLKISLTLFLASVLIAIPVSAATRRGKAKSRGRTHRQALVRTPAQKSGHYRNVNHVAPQHTGSRLHARRHVYSNPYTSPTFADSTEGDSVDGEDLVVRRAAVQALGPYNGTVVVVDPSNGRVLTMVNQKLALAGGFQPCSTIKLVAAVAGLSEGVITPETSIRLSRRRTFDLTDALAHSNNNYFASIGDKLGFDKIAYYARLMGLGEKAGWNIAGEEPGTLPAEAPKEGMGMMTSFGSGIYLTPLQLASLVSVFANGGTLYYLQYPKSQEEIASFQPKVKRQLDVARYVPEIKPGMNDAVEFGTARRANYDPSQPIYGKTGTCSDTRTPTHLGWFGSFNEVGNRKLVVAVLLTGGRPINGPVASGIAGQVYKILGEQNYFGPQQTASARMPLLATMSCCQ